MRGGKDRVGHAGIGAVDDEGDLGLFSLRQRISIAVGNDHAGLYLAAVYQITQLLLRFDVAGDVEVIGGAVGINQLAAGLRLIPVHNGDTQMLDVGRSGVAQQHKLDDGHQEHHKQRTWVTHDVQEFFAYERGEA